MVRLLLRVASFLATCVLAWSAGMVAVHATPQETVYRPKLAVPDALEPFLKYLEPGSDAFGAEGTVRELETQLNELGELLRTARPVSVVDRLLAPDFHGSRLPGVERSG